MCLAKLQPAKIGAFLLRQECTSDAMLTRQLHSFSAQCGLVYYYQQAAASWPRRRLTSRPFRRIPLVACCSRFNPFLLDSRLLDGSYCSLLLQP